MTILINPYRLVPAFSPLSLSPIGWYDPSDLSKLFQDAAMTTPVTTDGDVVGAMMDKSGNGYHLTQSTTANKPLYKTAAGLHWLEFDGVTDYLSNAAVPGSATWSMCAGVRFDGVTLIDEVMALNNGSGVSTQHSQLRRNLTAVNALSLNTANTVFTDSSNAISAATTYVITGLRTAAAVEALVNGVSNGTTAFTGTDRTGTFALFLGAITAAADFHDGRVYQAVYLGREFTGTERADTQAYVAAKSGITI